jgi:sec-independent protein translocase protein TatA
MIGDLFDSPWKIAIIAVVIIVLFGSKKLPHAARSLGQSMRILKREVQGLHEDDDSAPGTPAQASDSTATGFPQAELTAAPQPEIQGQFDAYQSDQQAQIDALQQQIRDLQRAATMDPAPAEAQRTQQPS